MAQYTLCWDCKKSTTGGCSWSRAYNPKPVKGWTARHERLKVNNYKGIFSDSYMVTACPEFERDSWGGGQYRHKKDFERVYGEVAEE